MMATRRQTGRGARNLGGTFARALVVVAFLLAAVLLTRGPTAYASSVHTIAQAGSCPVAGQCDVNSQTGCPKMGPLQATPPLKCASLPVSTFDVAANAPGGGCSVETIVKVQVPAGATEFEAVVYSNIGLGTRWWTYPATAGGVGAGAGPGQKIVNGAASYTVPSGYYAWQVGGGSGGSACSPASTTRDWLGDGAWNVVTPKIAGSGTLSIHGPTKNRYHTNFVETVTGTASGGANYVISSEQLDPAGGCASTYTVESAKSPTNWMKWPTGNGNVKGHFSLVAKFYAANLGTHGICSYLINKATNQTYAHAGLWWTNSLPYVQGSGTIGIHGPTKNSLGTSFSETVSGTASGGANYVVSGEQFDQTGGCAATYVAEIAKNDWTRWPTGTGSVSGHYSLIAKFGAANAGTHGICSYLINKTSMQTYAHAGLWWTNGGSANVAGAGTISVNGPTQNTLGTNFTETVSGTASGGANYVISGEQFYKAGGCATTYIAEVAKGSNDWHQWPTGTGNVSGSFSLLAKFGAANSGTHGICSYLINETTRQTYAYA